MDSLWVADIDGANAHRIVPCGTHVGDADWSPNGICLAFETTFIVNDNGVPVATGANAMPGDRMTPQRSGPKGADAKQLKIGCRPGGTRYLQALIQRLGQTLYLQEAVRIRL